MYYEKTKTIINNFIPSDALRQAIKKADDGKYLTGLHALKPMHLLRFGDNFDASAEVWRFAFVILNRQVERGYHLVTDTHGNNWVCDNTLIEEPGVEGRVDVPFLHIFLNASAHIFDYTPRLFFTRVRRSTKHTYQEGDALFSGEEYTELRPDAHIFVKLIAGSVARPRREKVYIWTDDVKNFAANHPTFIVHPNRMGDIETAFNINIEKEQKK